MLLSLIFSEPLFAVVFIIAVLISLTVHEFAHGITAYYYGDSTAKDLGRLSFNPLVHIDTMGALSFLVFGFGWGKPVPVNSLNFKNRKLGDIMTSLAGPASNLLMAIIFALIYHGVKGFLLPTNLLYVFLQLSFVLNIGLMVFNLIPMPPLDGSHLLLHAIPDQYASLKMKIRVYGPQVLLALVFLSIFTNISIFGWIYGVVRFFAANLGVPLFF